MVSLTFIRQHVMLSCLFYYRTSKNDDNVLKFHNLGHIIRNHFNTVNNFTTLNVCRHNNEILIWIGLIVKKYRRKNGRRLLNENGKMLRGKTLS